jgi:uncharacterized membrane protein YcaP (DUF421 family)
MPDWVISNNMWSQIFALGVPLAEKVLRPIAVYAFLVVVLRVFGKRELAQLNPFDLVVLLSLSNTVQNAIIGNDNSRSGGIIGAVALLAVNWLVVRALFSSPKLTRMFEGRSTVLIRDGKVDHKALQRESLSQEELLDVIHRQGFDNVQKVQRCELEPNGTFYVEAFEPTVADQQHAELLARLEALQSQVAALRPQSAGD